MAPEAGGSADSRHCFQETLVKVVIILFPKETQACNSETAVGAQASSHLPATRAIPAAASGQGPESLGGPAAGQPGGVQVGEAGAMAARCPETHGALGSGSSRCQGWPGVGWGRGTSLGGGGQGVPRQVLPLPW